MVKLGITPYPQFPSKGRRTMLRSSKGSIISFGKDVNILNGSSIIASYNGKISFGNDIVANQDFMIYSNSSIKIGNHVRFGWKVQIYDSSIHCMIDLNTGNITNPAKPIYIDDNVWIANHATISGGSKIPKFTIVASHSLVNKDFSDNSIGGILIGIPAKYKKIEKVRLLNEKIESIIKTKFISSEDHVNIQDLGYDVFPFNGETNILYRSK